MSELEVPAREALHLFLLFDQTTSHPYDDAVERAKRAMKRGTLKAILWHQGESDCDDERAPAYRAMLEQLIAQFRKDLGDPELAVIIGQFGQCEGRPWSRSQQMVTDAHIAVARELSHVEFVDSSGLTLKSDGLHFDSRSQREFGRRYAAAYLKLRQGTEWPDESAGNTSK